MKQLDSLFRFIANQLKGDKRSRRNSMRFKNYYLSVKDDKRNTFAKVFDYSVWRIIVFFFVFVYLYLETNRLYLSILLSSVIFTIVHSIAIKGRKRKLEYMKEQKRRYIGSQRVYNEIMNKTIDEMKEYIKEVFSFMGFTKFKFNEVDQRHILLKSVYKEEEIMLLFNIYKNDLEVELKEVKEFIDVLIDNKIKKGILLTTSDFTRDSYDYIKDLNEDYNVLLVNKEQLLKIIEDMGLFPTDDEIDEIIESKINKKQMKWNKYKNIALSKNKAKGYFILSIYLAIAAWYTPFTIYYMIISSAILALGIISLIFNSIRNSKKEEEIGTDFKKLLNDM